MITAQDRVLEIALHSAEIIGIDGSVSTDRRDYLPTFADGAFRMVARTPEPIRMDIALTLNGRKHLVHLVRDEQRNVRLDGLQSSGIASLWLTALDLFNMRFVVTRARDAAAELSAWLNGDGKTSEVATFIDVITITLEAMAREAADDFETKHNPFPALAIAA
ncbi:TPA: hypothetical protein QDB45_001640 [Burkholderia vietnamiensis]|nr:hypothetical protein [Burkholderia vietnamiensis]